MSKYIELYEDLKKKILNGEYAYGDKIPGEMELMRAYGYSRVTVITALNKLKERNYIVRKKGAGSYVNHKTSISENHQKTVALLVSNPNIFANLIISLRLEFSRHNINLSIYTTDLDVKKEASIVQRLQTANIDGIICYPTLFEESYNIWNNYIIDKFPIVFLDRFPLGMPCMSILDDGYRNMFNMTNYAISKGHRKIAYFTLPLQIGPVLQDRYNGFIVALDKNNLSIAPNGLSILPYSNSHYTESDMRTNIMQLLSNSKNFSLVICANGSLTIQFIKAAKTCGFKIPEDFSVIGHDLCFDDTICTTIQDYTEIGKEAAKLIVDRFNNANTSIHKIYVQGEFHEGITLKTLNEIS